MRLGLFAVGLVAWAAATAHADVDIAKADAAFDAGQKLKDAGQLDQACAKFKESLGFNPNAVGTMLNVALCEQQAGHIGSALKLFTEARDRGEEQNLGEHVKLAKQHIAEIAADVPFLAVSIVQRTDDTRLVVNDEVVTIKPDGTASTPIDPGLVTVIVSRPGRVPFEQKIDVKKGEHPVVRVERLKLPVTINNGRRRVGQILTYGGAGLAVAGLGLALWAQNDWHGYFDSGACHVDAGHRNVCNSDVLDKTQRDYTLGTVGTGVIIGGVAVAGIGAYLWFFGPHDETLAFVPRLDPEQAGIVAIGRF
jgi:tetratricopeptide (TPR) repeat protein